MRTPDAGHNIITRGLPKTGQTIQYQAGDDGTYEAGSWVGRLNANNRDRWIAKTIAGDDIVVDRATGLMWAADGNQRGCLFGVTSNWIDAFTWIITVNNLTFASFNDWRLPNMFELISILRARAPAPNIEQPPFSNTVSNYYWSSTSRPAVPGTWAMAVGFGNASIIARLKTSLYYLRCVRKGI